MDNDFSYPETIDYMSASIVAKSRKTETGQFEAVAALFFMGKRCKQRYAIASSRVTALRNAEKLLGDQSGGRAGNY